MVAIKNKQRASELKNKVEDIPPYLVYEWLDGVAIYYRDYKKVLSGELKYEEIMAYGNLQALLLTIIKDYLQPFFGNQFWLIPGEMGLHIAHNSNPSLDLCIYPKKAMSFKDATNTYTSIPPKVVIEVDTKADLIAFESLQKGNYYMLKTQRLLDYGTEEVIWIFTELKKVVVARPKQPWLTLDWTDEIEVMGHSFSIQQMIADNEKEGEIGN